jgi:4-amino-4-deoxy-L-arabinose transferase-like glycosyltransferase
MNSCSVAADPISSPGAINWTGLYRTCFAILLLGFGVRITLMLVSRSYLDREQGELVLIATSLAQGHGFANAYGDGNPTAHASPLYPLILSVVYRWFGTGRNGEIAQEVLNCFLAALTWSMIPLLCAICRLDRRVGMIAALLGATLTLNRWVETKGSSEGALAGLACVVLFLFYMKCWYGKDFSLYSAACAGILSGLAMLVSASLGSVVFALLLSGYFIFRESAIRQYLPFAATAIALLFMTLFPWALRNYFVLGGLVWTRSNLPLELMVSNNDDALPNLRDNENFWYKYHPFMSPQQRADVERLGELAYQRKLKTDVLRWISAHPGRFIRLTVERIYYFWFPVMKRPLQSIALGLFTLASIPGLIFLLKRRQLIAYALSSILLIYPIVYYFVQSHARYVYPIQWSLYLLSAQSAVLAVQRWMNGTLLPKPRVS